MIKGIHQLKPGDVVEAHDGGSPLTVVKVEGNWSAGYDLYARAANVSSRRPYCHAHPAMDGGRRNEDAYFVVLNG